MSKNSFSFVKKKIEPTTPQTEPKLEENVNKPKSGFGFIKKAPMHEVVHNTSDPGANTVNASEKNLLSTLENLLNDNYLFPSIEQPRSEETEDENVLNAKIAEVQTENQLNDSMTVHSDKPKKGFSFVKKKINTDDTLNPQTEENREDLHSDTKSLRSLKVNNNIRNENISVAGDDDDKSIEMNNSSAITNPIKDYPTSAGSKKGPEVYASVPTGSNLTQPEEVKERCMSDVKMADDALKELLWMVHSSKIKITAQQKELSFLHKTLEDLMHQETLAIEENDFEKAEQFEGKLTETRGRITKVEKTIKDIQQEQLQFREQELTLIKSNYKIFKDTMNAFGKLKQKQTTDLDNFNNTHMNKQKNDSVRLTKMKEKLHFLQTNLESEKSFIDQEETKITAVIKSQSSSVFEELEELNKVKAVIVEEVEELRRLLDAKLSELDVININIETKEIEIDDIKSNFQHELSKIEFKKKNYSEGLKDFEEQTASYEEKHKRFREEEKKFDEQVQSIKQKIQLYEEEQKHFEDRLAESQGDHEKKEYLLRNENEIQSKMNLIEMKIEKTLRRMEDNVERINKMNSDSQKMKTESAGIDLRIPLLEEEKKSYVTSRNFKEAGRVSQQLKCLIENKITNEKKFEENKEKVVAMEHENEKLKKDLRQSQEEKEHIMKDLNLARYEYLGMYKAQLEKFCDKSDSDFIREEIELVLAEINKLEALDYIRKSFEIKETSDNNRSDYAQSENVENKSDNGHSHSLEEKKDEACEDKEAIDERHSEDEQHNHSEDKENDHGEQQAEQEEIKDNIELITEIEEKINKLSEHLQEAVDAEDYDKADEIQTEIDENVQRLSLLK